MIDKLEKIQDIDINKIDTFTDMLDAMGESGGFNASLTNDGFKIAEEDLDIRGSGEILGSKQSGIPNFKLSNLDIHKHLLEMAREEAFNIVNKDPLLKSDQGKALKILLHLFKNTN